MKNLNMQKKWKSGSRKQTERKKAMNNELAEWIVKAIETIKSGVEK